MKRPLKTIVFLVSLLLVACSILTCVWLNNRNKTSSYSSLPASRSGYRFVCIYSGSSEYYKNVLQKGFDKASSDFNAWIKFYKFKPVETDKHCEAMDMALAANVDGIITNVPASDALQSYVETAYNKNIPVITIENDLPNSKRICFIGTNSYAYGNEAGRLMASATGGDAKIAMFEHSQTSKLSLKNQGFYTAIKEHPNMGTEVFNVNDSSIMEYSNIAQSIFVNHTQVNSFFCSDMEGTLGITRAMVEFNRTNKYVVGSGDSKEILKYIKNGLVYASLVEDPYSTAYLSVENLVKYKEGESISQYINPDIMVITKNNVDAILADRKGEE